MMRKSLLLSFCAFAFGASAQVLNPGMENWTGGNPNNWRHSNSGGSISIVQSTDAHNGTYSAQVKAVTQGGGLISNGRMSQMVVPGATPEQVDFWYKGNIIYPGGGPGGPYPNSDMAYCLVIIYFGGNVASDTLKLYSSENGNSFSQKTLVLDTAPFASATVDSVQIHFQLRDFSGGLTYADINSSFRVDDVTLTVANPSGEKQQISLSKPFLRVLPNPVTDGTIRFETNLSENGPVLVRVSDMQGRLVLEEIMANQARGNRSLSISASKLTKGNYILNIRQDNQELSELIYLD